jgi:hypothetical protein
MARIVLGSYVTCYPVGGFLSWTLQWLLGFHRLGHEVYLVEKCGSWPNPCFDLRADTMTADCSYGVATVSALLERFGLVERFCFVDGGRRYHGLSQPQIEAVFQSADLFVDISGGLFLPLEDTWQAEAELAARRICVDGEPGYSQMRMELRRAEGLASPTYDAYYTVGQNIGTALSSSPTSGTVWRPIFDPVNVDLYPPSTPPVDALFSTVMAWESHRPVTFDGRVYGQKDREFPKFITLPRLTRARLEIAVGGKSAPLDELHRWGWMTRESHAVTASFDAFTEYIRSSRGEFTVCKNVFVETNSGWFSDRSAVYLASGRPVVMQETGFSSHLPCGDGLFAVKSVEEAAAAIDEIDGDYRRHSKKAREIASEHLDAPKVIGRLLDELGI